MNEIISIIHKRGTELLQKDKCGKGYVCPLCGSGTGKHGTGMSTPDGIHFTCFSCNEIKSSDIIDIVGLKYGIKPFADKIKKCCELLKIPFAGEIKSAAPDTDAEPFPPPLSLEDEENGADAADYIAYYEKAAACINDTDYHRGLSDDTLRRFKIGYDNSWVNPTKPETKPSKRLIIPITDTCYLARSVDGDGAYSKITVGEKRFFNIECIKETNNPIFIVEGEIDALSIIDAGGQAVALSGISNAKKLADTLVERKPASTFIIALDNEPGNKNVQNAVATLKSTLDKGGILSVAIQPYEEYKDANEALCQNRDAFIKAIKDAETKALEYNPLQQYLASEVGKTLVNKFTSREDTTKCFPTVFDGINKSLDGGLYPGFYVVGAVSSLGKTTLCQNIADGLAKDNIDVLFFTLEMGKEEIVAKSLSCLTKKHGIAPKTTRDILSRTSGLSDKDKATLVRTAREYNDTIGNNLYIFEGNGQIGAKVIIAKTLEHARISKRPCVVFVDYLQILMSDNERASDKQNVDKAVFMLKSLSRELDIPVVAISSFNRESYDAPVTLASFKESGAIEYSADVLIGLQYSGIETADTGKKTDKAASLQSLKKSNDDKARKGEYIQIDFKVLKNRHGNKSTVIMDFCPKYNLFRTSLQNDDDLASSHPFSAQDDDFAGDEEFLNLKDKTPSESDIDDDPDDK
ncbi:MAG: DnaB-like helicase C-terminal domain-containing protein [Acutalibacteraceae bacterium]